MHTRLMGTSRMHDAAAAQSLTRLKLNKLKANLRDHVIAGLPVWPPRMENAEFSRFRRIGMF